MFKFNALYAFFLLLNLLPVYHCMQLNVLIMYNLLTYLAQKLNTDNYPLIYGLIMLFLCAYESIFISFAIFLHHNIIDMRTFVLLIIVKDPVNFIIKLKRFQVLLVAG